MRSSLSTFSVSRSLNLIPASESQSFIVKSCKTQTSFPSSNRPRFVKLCVMRQPDNMAESASDLRLREPASKETILEEGDEGHRFSELVVSPIVPAGVAKLSLSDQAFFLLAFIACTTSVAFTGLVVAAVPTLHAMARAAKSLSRLADTAREEIPSTMAAIRLSGMEISDLTLELSDLSQEINDGVTKSAQAVQAAEAGIKHIGSLARQQTISMIQERANLPEISLRPIVTGAARKTTQAVGQATKRIMNMISGAGSGFNSQDDDESDEVEN